MTTQRDIRSGTTYTTTWTYNAQDQARQMVYPTGEMVTTSYNAQGLPQQLAPYATNAEYNVAGQMTTLALANTVKTTFAYHGLTQRLTQVQTALGTTDLLKLGYSYDPVGNVTQIVDGVRTQTATFTYDTLDRLKTATIPSVYSHTVSYDSVGNITQRTDNGTATNDTYGDSAHKHAVTAAGSKSYGYDANGNMTNRAGDVLSYDNENHLASVTASNWVSTTLYAYDADGQRARKRVVSNGVTTTTYYVGNWLEVSEGVTTTYYYLGGQRVAMRRVPLQGEQQVTYLHSDHLGSTSAWSGSNSGSQAYYPFGLVRTTTGAPPTDFTYTGQRLDKSTAHNTTGTDGLLYYGARYYDAYLNRWAQPDSLVPDPAKPQYLNRYSYALNNPVRYNDPSGHCPFCLVGAAGGALGGAVYGYGNQVVTNLNQGMGWNSLTTNIDPGQIVFFTAAGTVIGGTLGVGLSVANVAITSAAATKAAATATTLTAAASADGDPTNEIVAGTQAIQQMSQTAQQLAPKIYNTANSAASVVDKLNRYLLSPDHPKGGSKAKWFRQALGFTKDNADDLAAQIVFDPSKAVPTELTQFGQKYEQLIKIVGANGKEIEVPFTWIRNVDEVVRLVTVPWIPEP